MNWALSVDRITRAAEQKSIAKLGFDWSGFAGLAVADGALSEPSTDSAAFAKTVRRLLSEADLSLTAPQLKAFVAGLSERDESAPIVRDAKGNPVADTDLRDTENVPLTDDIEAYVAREIEPHVEHFWVDRLKDKIGYEIPFTRHFYKYVPPRSLEEIDADLNVLIGEINVLLTEVEKR